VNMRPAVLFHPARSVLLCAALVFAHPAAADPGLRFAATPIPSAATPLALGTSHYSEGVASGSTSAGNEDMGEGLLQQLSIHRLEDNIATLQADSGPYAPALAEQYLALGQMYRQAGDDAAALAQLEKAEHAYRLNNGLNAPEQFRPIELSIDIHLARKDYRQAVERQEYLVHLHQSRYGGAAAEVAPELAELGDMYFAAFERNIRRRPAALEPEPTRTTAKNVEPGMIETAFMHLYEAQTQYFRSISNLLGQGRHFDPLLVRLETSLINTLFLQAHQRTLAADPDFFLSYRDPQSRDMLKFDNKREQLPGYRSGVKAFTRIVAYLQHNPETEATAVARAMLELGDWHLLFGHQRLARQQYAAARAWLLEHDVSAAEQAAVLEPAVPVQLPTFVGGSNRLHAAKADNTRYDGYIDVGFSVNANGRISDLAILDRSANADALVEARLRKVLYNAPFRPGPATLADNGDEQHYSVRYNFVQL